MLIDGQDCGFVKTGHFKILRVGNMLLLVYAGGYKMLVEGGYQPKFLCEKYDEIMRKLEGKDNGKAV